MFWCIGIESKCMTGDSCLGRCQNQCQCKQSFQIFHCGISRATFTVGNADGTGVAYKTVALAKGEDNLWYANITFAEGVDTADYAVGVTKGDANYLYTELGVSGIKIKRNFCPPSTPIVTSLGFFAGAGTDVPPSEGAPLSEDEPPSIRSSA